MNMLALTSLGIALVLAAFSAPSRTEVRLELAVATRPTLAPDWFPPAKEGIKIVPQERGPTCEDLLGELERVTGAHVIVSNDTRSLLSKIPTGLMKPMDVPAAQVWPTVESILSFNEFVLSFVNREEPRVLSVQSLQGAARTKVRENAVMVKHDELAFWTKHPCFIVTTMLDLDAIDVRQVSNSMRQLFNDPNTHQIIPVGNSNTLIVTGFGPNVAALSEALLRCNEIERKRLAEEAKKAPPPTPAAEKKSETK